MYKHTMMLTYLNLKTSSSFSEEYTHYSDEPLVTLSKDLLGNENVAFDFYNESWVYFSYILNNIFDKDNNTLVTKVARAIRRRLKGTAKGIHVTFRDKDNLIWHVIVTFLETVEVSNK